MPRDFGYETGSIGLSNKLGSQNDYLGVVTRKPRDPSQPTVAIAISESLTQNAGADTIDGGNISTGGNRGIKIAMQYRQASHTTSYDAALIESVAG